MKELEEEQKSEEDIARRVNSLDVMDETKKNIGGSNYMLDSGMDFSSNMRKNSGTD